MEKLLFSPHDVPGLYDAFGTDSFDELYTTYEQIESIPKKDYRRSRTNSRSPQREGRDWSYLHHEY
jgi:hypothetical protein